MLEHFKILNSGEEVDHWLDVCQSKSRVSSVSIIVEYSDHQETMSHIQIQLYYIDRLAYICLNNKIMKNIMISSRQSVSTNISQSIGTNKSDPNVRHDF